MWRLQDPPEVFGLHENADISCAQQETISLFATLLSLQPRSASGSSRTAEEETARVAADIQRRLPPTFDLAAASAKFPIDYLESMHTVLTQELRRFNALLATVASSLDSITQALQGLISLSSELELVVDAIFDGQVPEMWSRRSYPSKKPLGSWVNELIARVEFFRRYAGVCPLLLTDGSSCSCGWCPDEACRVAYLKCRRTSAGADASAGV